MGTLRSVVRMLLKDVSKRLEDLDMQMTLSDAAIDHALREAYDPELGARPLRRYLEKYVVSLLSRKIIAGNLAGGCRATVDYDGSMWCVHSKNAGEADCRDNSDPPMARTDSLASKRTSSCTSRSEANHTSPKR